MSLIGDNFAVITARHWTGISVGTLQISAVEHVASIVNAVAGAGLPALLRRWNDRRQILIWAVLADFIRDEKGKKHQEKDDYGKTNDVSVVHKFGQGIVVYKAYCHNAD